MNKKIIIILVVTLVLLSGIVLFKKPKAENKNSNGEDSTKNVFVSIKDALSKDLTLACEFKDEQGNSTKSYIKNGAVRISTNGKENQSGEIIIRNNKMYMWDPKSKAGFIYEIPDEEKGNVGMTGEGVNQSDTYLRMIDKYKDTCKTAAIEDSYFEEPKDISFQDMSKLLQDIKNQMPAIPQQ